MRSWLYIVLFLLSPQVYAGIFTPPPQDKSVQLLGIIFGDSIGSISLGGNVNPVLSDLMEKFNLVMVVIGLIVLSYVSIMSTINTAQEGSAMGKKWSAVWAPLRSLVGMAIMVPAKASGYSTIQVTVMWIILNGIGAADQLWNIALEGLSSGVSAMAGVTSKESTTDMQALQNNGNALALQLLRSAICMQAFNKFNTNKAPATDHSGAANDWVASNAIKIKDFVIHNPPTYTSTTGADGYTTQHATASGTIYYGVNDSVNGSVTNNMKVCGSVYVQGEVYASDAKTASSSTAPVYDYTTAQSQAQLEADAATIYEAKINAVDSVMASLKPLAQAIVSDQDANTVPNVYTSVSKLQYPAGYAVTARDAYTSIMSGLIIPNSAPTDQALIDAQNVGEASGWIVAGSYYFVFNKQIASKRFNDRKTPINGTGAYVCDTVTPLSDGSFCQSHGFKQTPDSGISTTDKTTLALYSVTSDSDLTALTRYLTYGEAYLNNDKNTTLPTSLNFSQSLAGADGVNALVQVFGAAIVAPVMDGLMNLMQNSSDTDPVLAHAQLGRDIMLGCEFAWIGIMAAMLVSSLAAYPPLGFGQGPTATITAIIATVLGVLLPVIAIFWGIGATLGIYLPLIPYMMFTLAALGWLLLVVECIVAAPVIALGLIIPAGDEMGKVEHALGLLANVFLRPMLMIFGFILAGRVYAAVVSLINFGMLDVFNTINVNTIFSSVVILFVYASFIISVTNTCFSLIYAIPDKLLRWIGIHHESTDVSALQQVKGAGQQAAGQVGGGMAESGKMGQKGAQQRAGKGMNNAMSAIASKFKGKK